MGSRSRLEHDAMTATAGGGVGVAGGRSVACTVSRYESTCAVCSGNVRPGDRVFCFEMIRPPASDDGGAGTSSSSSSSSGGTKAGTATSVVAWGHEHCHDASLPPPPPCRHWIRLGRCPALELGMCAFRHDDVVDASAGGYSSTSTSDDKCGRRWGGRRRNVRNRHKNATFRIFLMRTYGSDYLNYGRRIRGRGEVDDDEDDDDDNKRGVILDVAGGKGELSFELLNLSGASECVVIDPRPMNLSLVMGKWTKGLYEPRRVGSIFSKWYPACEDGCRFRIPRMPKHFRCLFDGCVFAKFASAIEPDDVNRANGTYARDVEEARRMTWTTRGLRHEDGSSHDDGEHDYDGERGDREWGTGGMDGTETVTSVDVDGMATDTTSDIVDPAIARDILRRCHLVVGLHPDQATGEIIEYAMAMNVPYCIVPCCVYSNAFAKRKLRNGTRVTTFDHLVTWLCERDPRARTAELDLDGKNTVVYTLPVFLELN